MGLSEYLAGAAFLAFVLAAAAYTAYRVARFALGGEPSSTVRMLGAAVAFLATLVASHMVPGLLGLLSPAAVALAAGGFALAATRLPHPAWAPAPRPASPAGPVEWVAVGVGLAVLTAITANAIHLAPAALSGVDATTFHMPAVVSWMQSESIWGIWQFVPDQWHGYYPMTGNIVWLAAALPWDSEFAIRLVQLPLVPLAMLAVYATGRELGADRGLAGLLAGASLSYPAVTGFVSERTTPDIFMYATFSLGALFLVRHLRTRGQEDLVLAGVALGLCFGSRWYAVPATVLLALGWGVALARLSSLRSAITPVATVGGLTGLLGSFWLLRNTVQAGNPLMPVSLEIGGLEILSAPADPAGDRLGSTIAGYADQPGVLFDTIAPQLLQELGWVSAAIGVTLIAGAIATITRHRQGAGSTHALLGFGAIALFAAYTLTPFSALGPPGDPSQAGVNVRYAVPAVLLAAPLAAAFLSELPETLGRPAAVVLAALAALAVLDGPDAPATRVALAAAVIGIVALSLASSPTVRRLMGLSLAAATTAGGFLLADRFIEGRYAEPPALERAVSASSRAPARVAIAGRAIDVTQPVLPVQGDRLSSRVEFVGEFEDGALRAARTRDEFARRLAEGDYDLLLIAKGDLVFGRQPREERWARTAGWSPVDRDPFFTLFAPPPAGR